LQAVELTVRAVSQVMPDEPVNDYGAMGARTRAVANEIASAEAKALSPSG
jgi:hypothetical protein